MNKKLDDKLCKDFPNLFIDRNASMKETCMCWGFPGDGWYNIIREAAKKLEPLIVSYKKKYPNKKAPRASQVKEKFGTLRFYLDHGTEEMNNIVREAEKKSERICELCGDYGKIRRGLMIYTLCEKCYRIK